MIEEISSEEISTKMLQINPVSLNELSYQAVIRALKKIQLMCSENPQLIISNIYVDTVGDPEYYKNKLIDAVGKDYGK